MSPWCESWGFDLASADGYLAWREAGGLWPDETPERMQAYREAQAVSDAVDEEIAEREGCDEEAA